MIDYSTVQSLIIPDGEVILIEDGKGNVLWQFGQAVEPDKTVILEVAKRTLATTAGETTYENEEFILLDIYPKEANSTVIVTYGGLTKLLKFSGTNAMSVYFGTFNGVSDDVETPASGTLTIEGGYRGIGCGSYKYYDSIISKTQTRYCSCITSVAELGGISYIPNNMFYDCYGLTSITIPDSVTQIGNSAFYNCNLTSITIPDSVTSIGTSAFYNGGSFTEIIIPKNVKQIGDYAFQSCDSLENVVLPEGLEKIGRYAFSTHSDVLNSFVIPSTVKEIGNHAFPHVVQFIILATTPPSIVLGVGEDYNLFEQTSELTIIVPKGCGEAYKAAEGWSLYTDYIVEAS